MVEGAACSLLLLREKKRDLFKMKGFLAICILGMFVAVGVANNSSTTDAASNSTASTSAPTTTTTARTTTTVATTTSSTTTLTPEEECGRNNGSCDKCVAIAKCLYCKSNNKCLLYPTGDILPTSVCALDEARWGVCWLNFEALIISVSVVGGVLLISLFCCIYCCCCRGKRSSKLDKDETRFESQRMERKVKQDERRAERKGRLDEIRKKYGLMKDEAPYQRFDS